MAERPEILIDCAEGGGHELRVSLGGMFAGSDDDKWTVAAGNGCEDGSLLLDQDEFNRMAEFFQQHRTDRDEVGLAFAALEEARENDPDRWVKS